MNPSLFRTLLTIVCLAAVLTFCSSDSVRAADKPNWQAGLTLTGAFPSGEFSDELDDAGGGIGIDGVWMPNQSPFGLGLAFEYIVYGDQTRREPLSGTIPDIVVDVNTTNNIVQTHLFLRTGYRHGGLRPYVDALVGFKYLYTRTSLDGVYDSGGDEIDIGSTNFDDWAFSFGLRGGVHIRVYDGFAKKKGYSVFIDLRGGYLFGGEAEYLKEGSITTSGTSVFYDISQSKTNLAMAHLGVSVDF
ncbi:hypothetical protein GF420_02265 [candidate division GN15 bacterium]|nr:hypothetical protein [candidate division GN15 bacterium]